MNENRVEFQAPKPERKPKNEIPYLYATCDCEDFEWKQDWFIERDKFEDRLRNSQRVMVARHTDLMILPEMGERRDDKWCVWYDDLNILNLLCVTREKTNRAHLVQMTLGAGGGCDWVCKHIVCASRWLLRRKYRLRHVFVCWAGDRRVEKSLAWSQHQAGGLVGTKSYRLAEDVYVLGWRESPDVAGSVLFEVKKNEKDSFDTNHQLDMG